MQRYTWQLKWNEVVLSSTVSRQVFNIIENLVQIPFVYDWLTRSDVCNKDIFFTIFAYSANCVFSATVDG